MRDVTPESGAGPDEPRTKAGRRLADRAKRQAFGNWEGIRRFDIPAIEAEARAYQDGPHTYRMAAPSSVTDWTVIATTREVPNDAGTAMESRDEWWHVPTFVVGAIEGEVRAELRRAVEGLPTLGLPDAMVFRGKVLALLSEKGAE